jgi:hypothetical protein
MYTLYQRGLHQINVQLNRLLFPGGVRRAARDAEEEIFLGKIHAIAQFAGWFGQKQTSVTTKISDNNIAEDVLHFTEEICEFVGKAIPTIDSIDLGDHLFNDNSWLEQHWGLGNTHSEVPIGLTRCIREKFSSFVKGKKKISKLGKKTMSRKNYFAKVQFTKYNDPDILEDEIETYEELKQMVSSGCTLYQSRCWMRNVEMTVEVLKHVPAVLPFKENQRLGKLKNFRYLRDLGGILFEHGMAIDTLVKNVISEYE